MIFSKIKNYKKKNKRRKEAKYCWAWQAMLVPCLLKEEPTCRPARENCA
jgi:hypothetical protein